VSLLLDLYGASDTGGQSRACTSSKACQRIFSESGADTQA